MHAHAVITCPLREFLRTGRREPALGPTAEPHRVVGWVNVLELTIAGQRRYFLLSLDPRA